MKSKHHANMEPSVFTGIIGLFSDWYVRDMRFCTTRYPLSVGQQDGELRPI